MAKTVVQRVRLPVGCEDTDGMRIRARTGVQVSVRVCVPRLVVMAKWLVE
jgi:hypothetical protein